MTPYCVGLAISLARPARRVPPVAGGALARQARAMCQSVWGSSRDQGDAGVLVLVRQHAGRERDAQAGRYQVDDKVDLWPLQAVTPGALRLALANGQRSMRSGEPTSNRMKGESARSVKSMRVRWASGGPCDDTAISGS